MKNAIKWIFFAIVIVILAIDIAGFWKYKLKKTSSVTTLSTSSENETVNDSASNNEIKEQIEYKEAESKNFVNGEKLFITDIKKEDDGKYTVKGLIYEQYEVTKDEYTKLKNAKSNIEILGIEYSKDKIQSNNLKLKSSNENAENLYIKYDTKTKKYVLKDSTTDYSLYKKTEKYVQISVSEQLEFDIVKNGKTNKQTVKSIADSYKDITIPEDAVKINLSTITFNKSGKCIKIVETDM